MLRHILLRKRFLSSIANVTLALLVLLLFLNEYPTASAAPRPLHVSEEPQIAERTPPPSPPQSVQHASTTANIDGIPVAQPFAVHNQSGDPPAWSPSIAYNPDRMEYLVVWHNERPVYPDIQAQRVSWDGKQVGSSFFISGGEGEKRRYPDVVYNTKQKQYLVVWESEPDSGRINIRARFVSGEGTLLGIEYALGSGPALRNRTRPAVAYASVSDKFMVVWESAVQGALSTDIEAVVLDSGGAVQKQFIVASSTINHSYSQPDLAYNRSRNEYLVVYTWNDRISPNYDIRARRVTRDGTLLGTGPLDVGDHTLDEFEPAVAALPTTPDNGKYMVAWHIDATDFDIYAREVLGGGTMGSLVLVAFTYAGEQLPAIAASESNDNYLLSWTHDDHSTLVHDDVQACIV